MVAIPAEVGGGWSSEGCEGSSDSSMDMADMVTGTRGSVEDTWSLTRGAEEDT